MLQELRLFNDGDPGCDRDCMEMMDSEFQINPVHLLSYMGVGQGGVKPLLSIWQRTY